MDLDQILDGALKGEHQAWAELIKLLEPELLRYFKKRRFNQVDSEDLAQNNLKPRSLSAGRQPRRYRRGYTPRPRPKKSRQQGVVTDPLTGVPTMGDADAQRTTQSRISVYVLTNTMPVKFGLGESVER